MAASMTGSVSKTLLKSIHSTFIGYGIGCRSLCSRCRFIREHPGNHNFVKRLHSRQLCTSSGFWQQSKEEADREKKTLEKFAKELDVKEKPKRFKAWAPADDVYMIAHYPPKEILFHEAMELLRSQASWSYVPGCEYKDRSVVVSILIDLNLGPKPMPAFSNLIVFPNQFWKENKILCFAEGDDAKVAEECGANVILSKDRISEIADGEIDLADFDFCVGTRAMLPHLSSIRSILKDKFPNTKKGSSGKNIGLIIQRHKFGRKYQVEETKKMIRNFQIGNLGLSDEQIEENFQFLINVIQSHKPQSKEPFIKWVRIGGYHLDGYKLKFQDYIPQEVEVEVDTRSELEKIEDELRQLRAS
ncbi:39S ribosomal protein L1, mitochondrial [Holothuria leucospilota]|uniref:39S ribosomal protein L1, mitochondrial n=1 Tax=Holothuria leucospilota TaxID=206669 RepID=A0A9Q1BDH3_HOLLE|nr:39S ribosomal protein L1, mitochondrial [Holothuria leucospilota]